MKSKIAVIILLALTSVLASYFGLGIAYHERINPSEAWEEIQQVGADGKLSTGAAITYRHLSAIGNVLTLDMVPVRPPGSKPPQMTISVCDEIAAQFQVGANPLHRIPLRAACEPFRIGLSTDDPYFLPNDSTPHVGVRLIYADVNSRLGVPIIGIRKVAECFAAIFALAVVCIFLSWDICWGLLSLAVPFVAFLLIRVNDGLDLKTQYPLWVFCFLMSCGALVCKTFGRTPTARVRVLGSKGSGIAILAIVALGAALRLHGLSFGLPMNFHPDEVPKVNAIMRMVDSHSLNPSYFLHPSLLLYLSYFTNLTMHAFGWSGEFRASQFLAGRFVSAMAGTCSIFLVYALGKRFFSSTAGLFAAALLAFSPLHVTCSRYMKEDALLTFFVLAATLAVIKAAQENRKLLLYMSGALVGCAASSKYPGVLSAVLVCSAPWLKSKSFKPERSFVLPTIIALLLVPIFFVICVPYSVITPTAFAHGIAYEHNHMEKGHSEVISAWSQLWMYHFWRSILPGLTPLTALLSIAGAGFLLWRRRIDDLFIVGMILTFYLPAEWVKAKPAPQPERYILPCLPFLILALSGMFNAMWRERTKKTIAMLAVLALVSSATRSVELAAEVPHDTRIELAMWMKEHLPAHSKVVVDVPLYGPAITAADFDVTYLPRLTIFEALQAKSLKRSGGDYVVLSSLFYNRYFSQPNSGAVFRQLFRDLETELPIVKIEAPVFGTYGFHNPHLIIFSLKPDDIARLKNEEELKRQGKIAQTSNDVFGTYW